MLRIERTLPGELDGTLKPQDYGFEVIPAEPVSLWERDERVAALYRQVLERTGMQYPVLEAILAGIAVRHDVLTQLDRKPVEKLLATHNKQYPYECRFGNADLVIDEGVFCPTFTNASPLLLSAVDFTDGEHVLDAFSGSGAFGINAALGGSKVVCFDKSEKAVDCTRKNAESNAVSDSIVVRHGTLQETIYTHEKFNLVIANPPLLPGNPESDLAAAVFDPGLQATIELIQALSTILTINGRCYIITSDVMERCGFDIVKLCRNNKLRASLVENPDFGYESYRVHRITRRQTIAQLLFRLSGKAAK